jgi:hypothetical protein
MLTMRNGTNRKKQRLALFLLRCSQSSNHSSAGRNSARHADGSSYRNLHVLTLLMSERWSVQCRCRSASRRTSSRRAREVLLRSDQGILASLALLVQVKFSEMTFRLARRSTVRRCVFCPTCDTKYTTIGFCYLRNYISRSVEQAIPMVLIGLWHTWTTLAESRSSEIIRLHLEKFVRTQLVRRLLRLTEVTDTTILPRVTQIPTRDFDVVSLIQR